MMANKIVAKIDARLAELLQERNDAVRRLLEYREKRPVTQQEVDAYVAYLEKITDRALDHKLKRDN